MKDGEEGDPVKAGRKQNGGRFRPGQSGNPAGKPSGTRHRITRAVEVLLEGEAEALTRKAIEKGLEGDIVALRLCLERIAPVRKDAPISVELPAVRSAADAVDASAMVLAAMAQGDITPSEAGAVMSLLTAHKTIVEAGDLEARVAALEHQRGEQNVGSIEGARERARTGRAGVGQNAR